MSTGMGRRGFTLLEVVVALTVTGVVLSAVLGISAATLRASRRAVAEASAAALAESVLEGQRLELRALLVSGNQEGRFPPPFEEYTWHASARPVPEEERLIGIRVEVVWPEGEFTLETRARRPRSMLPTQASR